MTRLAQLATILLLAAWVCFAADKPAVINVATLQNGFSIRFDHRELRGPASRLFLDAQGNSFVDVRTADVVSFDQDLVPAAGAPHIAPRSVSDFPELGRDVWALSSGPKRMDIPDAIAAASDRHGIDADLLYSVIRAESDFNSHAVSPKGAQGLMQLMPATAANLGVANAFDTASNVDAGTRYLRELLDRYHYDLAKALAAYNAGPARVDQYHGVPPFHETRVYVARIIRDYNRAVLSRRQTVATKQSSVASSRSPVLSSGN
ncbi:MAG: lytic transglycosylase domain-containing protein [Terriglobales bacterium]